MSQFNFEFAPTDAEGFCTDPEYLQVLKEQLDSFGIPQMSLKDIDRFLSLLAHDLWKRPEILRICSDGEWVFKDGKLVKG